MRYLWAAVAIVAGGFVAYLIADAGGGEDAPRAAERSAPPEVPPPKRTGALLEATRCPRVYAGYGVEGLRCFVLAVPADHWAPKRGRVRLMLARVGNARGKADPLLVVPGGPGGSSEAYLAILAASDAHRRVLLRDRPVFLLDPRGSGASRPSLACPPSKRADPIRATVECAARLERRVRDLGLFDARQSAADLGAVARAIEPDGVDVYAASWGTRVALEAMAVDGEALEEVVLDGVVPADTNLFTSRGPNLEEALRALRASCRRQDRCRRIAPDLGKDLDRLGRRYGEFLAPGLTDLLASRFTLPRVPGLVHDAAKGRMKPLLRELRLAFAGRSAFAEGAYLSGVCRDRSARTPPRRIAVSGQSVSPLASIAAWHAGEDRDSCVVWPVDPARQRSPATEGLQHRALLLAGLYDPITPPSAARRAMTAFEDAELVIIRHASHTVFDTPCGLGLIAAFADERFDASRTACARRELALR